MQQLTNFGSTTLVTTISSTHGTLDVVDASAFPTSGDFTILIEAELLNVTGVSGSTFTIVRGQEGTTAAIHNNGAGIKLVLSKAVLENFFSERFLVGGYASRPSSPRAGQRYFANDVDLGWEFNGTNWDLIHPLFVPYAHRVDLSGWTATNLGASVWTDLNGVMDISMPPGTTNSWRFYHKNVPTPSYSLNAIWRTQCFIPQYTASAIGLHDGANKLLVLSNFVDGNTCMNVYGYNSNTFDAFKYSGAHQHPSYYWTRIRDDNTNWYFEFSTDGMHYNIIHQETRNSYFTATKLMFGVDRTESLYLNNIHAQCLGLWEG